MNRDGNTVATPGWITVYPTTHKRGEECKTRAAMLINSRLSTSSWTQIDVNSDDITAIQITNEKATLDIYNIYNDCEHQETIETLRKHMEERKAERDRAGDRGRRANIWVGDFNRHHPMWEARENKRLMQRRDLDFAEPLINLIADNGMSMALPLGTPTIVNSHGNRTRPDNVFVSEEIEGWVMECKTMEDHRPPRADHFPIHTAISYPTPKKDGKPRYDFRDVDWTELRRTMEDEISKIKEPEKIDNVADLETALDDLEKAIKTTIHACVPEKHTTKYSKRWWTPNLKQARNDARKAAGRSRRKQQYPDHPAHEEKRKARNDYANLLKLTKRLHWEEWLEDMNNATIWDGHRFARAPAGDGGRTRIPALTKKDQQGNTTEVKNNEEKSKLLHAAFFFSPPDNPNVDPDYEYPEEAFKFENVTKQQIIRVAKKLKPYSAPGRNMISNSILSRCIDILADHLLPIYRATFELNHYPTRWKRYTTIVLRKQGKADYKTASAYRPIALLDTIAKLLSACVKETLEHHTERLMILPNRQFGGRPGCTTTDSLHMLAKFTKDAWRKNQEVAAIFMDVKGAFPNTVIPCLIHDLRKAGIPKEYADWVAKRTEGRETVISFDDYESEPIPIDSGLDQGCNLSTFFYRFYNADQIRGSERKKDELATNFADDAIQAAAGATAEEATRKLEEAFHRPGGPLEWAKTHFSTYEYHKFAFMVLSRKRTQDPNNPRRRIRRTDTKIRLEGKEIAATEEHKFLGVILDAELRFKKHANYAIEKGTKVANQIRRLSKNAQGMKGELARRMYYTSITTSMLYAADIWCPPPPRTKGKRPRGMGGIINKMESVQRRAAIQATGALRTTPSDLLFAHADMLPMDLQIQHICNGAAIRMAALPKTHPLSAHIQNAASQRPKRHPSPLHIVMNMNSHTTKGANMEKIPTTPRGPRWKPAIKPKIAKDREAGIKMDKEDDNEIKIYTDGSGHDGGIGAAAVLYHGFRNTETARKHLGNESKHTVFEAECVGQLLALQLLKNKVKKMKLGQRTLKASIAVDNQSSLTCHTRREHQPGSNIIEAVNKTHRDLKARHTNLHITYRWVPGHEDIPGSDKADGEAKKAAEGEGNNTKGLEGILRKSLPTSKAATRQHLKKKNKESNIKRFRASWRYDKFAKIDATIPSSGYRKTCKTIPRNNESLLIKLRTGHIPLNAYLHRFHLEESPMCQECNEEPESVTHYLKYCKAYEEQRKKLKREVGPGRDVGPEILGDKRNLKALFRYIHGTQRFTDTHGDTRLETQAKADKRGRQDNEEEEEEEWNDRQRWG